YQHLISFPSRRSSDLDLKKLKYRFFVFSTFAFMCNPKEDSIYMMRCMELARLGMPYAKPNPMVGSVLVHQGKIISEGWHQYYGRSEEHTSELQSRENL